MTAQRARLTHAELAALARLAFGLTDAEPELPPATEFEDAEGVLIATRGEGGLAVREITRWRSPATVRAELAARGWSRPAAWIGQPPDDVSGLPDQLLVLLPVAGTAAHPAVTSPRAPGWGPPP